MSIQNPILRGFNPDPSICRVGDDYYIATSTFEWFPGVQIHHSRDLKNWKVIAQPLNRVSQLDMKGVPDSCGVWAPCLSHHEGTFYLVYTNVKSFNGVWKDTPNYVVTTEEIRGEWSEPSYLNSAGFDGSMFHDTNGKSWFVTMVVDHRNGLFFGGIELQEYSKEEKKLVGEVHYLTEGTELGKTEGPHLYQKNGYYYLLLAEGGTEYGHAATVLRSKEITGPYESHPANPILTCAGHPEHGIQKSGHASFVETQDGDWYITFLVGRPLSPLGRCTLGRETAIEELVWKEDGWPYLKEGSIPRLEIPESKLPSVPRTKEETLVDFGEELPLDFQSLRIPKDESWISQKERPGFLRLKGKESLSSTHNQALIARRVQSFHVEASTLLEFSPKKFQQMAGLVFYYNTGHYHYLHLTTNGSENFLSIVTSDNFSQIEQEPISIGKETRVYLKGEMNHDRLQFYFSLDGEGFAEIGKELDASILSDDYVRDGDPRYRPAFTGCFVGICCQDLVSNSHHADFKWFEYRELG